MSTAYPVADYLAQTSPHTWLVDRLLPVGGSLLLYGDPKIGKSFLALHLAATLTGANGADWLGFPITTPGPVLYLQLDTPRSLWQERLAALAPSLTYTDLFIGDRESLDTWPFDILNPAHAAILQTLITHVKPSAVIIDVIREVHRRDENESTAMQHVMSALVAATRPAALVLIAHAKKPLSDAQPNLLADIRGSSYLPGAVDAIARLTETGLYFTGRSLEGGVKWVTRTANGLWTLQVAPQEHS